MLEADGQRRLNRNLVNGSAALKQLLGDLPAGTPVAFEAAYGWTWLLELLDDLELEPHLAHASRCKAIASARLKDDRIDARTLAFGIRSRPGFQGRDIESGRAKRAWRAFRLQERNVGPTQGGHAWGNGVKVTTLGAGVGTLVGGEGGTSTLGYSLPSRYSVRDLRCTGIAGID